MRTLNLCLLFFFLFALNSYSLSKCEGDDFAKWNNCSGTVSLDDSKWEAEFRNGLPNGKGTITYVNGNKYVGKLKDGEFHGKGTFTFSNGGKYVGGFKDGTMHGKGTFTSGKGPNEGDRYVGGWKDGKYHGQGTYTFSNGNKYVGGWKDGKKHGIGTDYDRKTGFRSEYEFQDGEIIEFLRVY